jgi:hypothetical protein
MSGMEILIRKAAEAGLIRELVELREACDVGPDPWWRDVAADIDAELDRRVAA